MRKAIGVLVLAALSCQSEGPRAGAATSNAPEQRTIVRTADMRIVVNDTRAAVDAVTSSVEGIGGVVSASNVWRDGDVLRARLTLRVPPDKLAATLASLRGMARRVERESVTSEDVRTQYVELDARAPAWHPAAVARDATRALVIALQALATLAIWLAICVVPIAAMLALFVVQVRNLFRRRRIA